MKPVLVRCDGAGIPARVRKELGPVDLDIRTQGPRAALTLRVQPVSDALKGTVSDRAADLTRVAAYVYWADQMVSRGGEADVTGQRWRRRFVICAPVSDPDFWNATPLRSGLEDVLEFLSEDAWFFHFSKASFAEQLYLDTDPLALRNDPDCVVLFSGGADSLCAIVEAFAVGKQRPALVSHRATPMTNHRQQSLVDHLRTLLKGWYFPRTSVLVNKAQSRERDTNQRTRSFLFASLAASVASALHVPDVILADNGVVSLNLPINDQLLGALASRSTHPKFIRLFNDLAARVLAHQPQVSNPFWNRTRAEALQVLKVAGVPELLQETNSCGHSRGLPAVTPHCGTCSQCVDRRFASVAAGLEEHDLAERYAVDIFRDALRGDGLMTAESYVRFARRVNRLSGEELFEEFPQMNDCILSDEPLPHEKAADLANMIKRQAAESMRVLSEQVAAARVEVVEHTLPPTSLIQIAIERERAKPEYVAPSIRLSAPEEREFVKHRFKSRLIVEITGKTEGRKTNLVMVDGGESVLTDADLKLFLRLVVALHQTEDGFISRDDFRRRQGIDDELAIAPEGLDQRISRIRARVRPALAHGPEESWVQPKDFIEWNRTRVRLSTHKRYVLFDRDRLACHPDQVIQSIAQRLPIARGAKQRFVAPA